MSDNSYVKIACCGYIQPISEDQAKLTKTAVFLDGATENIAPEYFMKKNGDWTEEGLNTAVAILTAGVSTLIKVANQHGYDDAELIRTVIEDLQRNFVDTTEARKVHSVDNIEILDRGE